MDCITSTRCKPHSRSLYCATGNPYNRRAAVELIALANYFASPKQQNLLLAANIPTLSFLVNSDLMEICWQI